MKNSYFLFRAVAILVLVTQTALANPVSPERPSIFLHWGSPSQNEALLKTLREGGLVSQAFFDKNHQIYLAGNNESLVGGGFYVSPAFDSSDYGNDLIILEITKTGKGWFRFEPASLEFKDYYDRATETGTIANLPAAVAYKSKNQDTGEVRDWVMLVREPKSNEGVTIKVRRPQPKDAFHIMQNFKKAEIIGDESWETFLFLRACLKTDLTPSTKEFLNYMLIHQIVPYILSSAQIQSAYMPILVNTALQTDIKRTTKLALFKKFVSLGVKKTKLGFDSKLQTLFSFAQQMSEQELAQLPIQGILNSGFFPAEFKELISNKIPAQETSAQCSETFQR